MENLPRTLSNTDISQRPRHEMAQAVSGWPLIALARVQFQASLRGICSRQSGTDSGVSFRVFLFFSLNIIPTMLHTKILFNRHRR